MTDDNNSLKKATLELTPISKDIIISNMNNIVEAKIAVFRKNSEKKLEIIHFNKLKQFFENNTKDIKFYIDKNWKSKFPNASVEKKKTEKPLIRKKTETFEEIKQYGDTLEQIEKFHNLSIVEREEILDNSLGKLHELNKQNKPFDIEAIIKIIEVVANTFYSNYSNLEDNLASENIKNNLLGIYTKTEWAIKMLIDLFQSESYKYEDYSIINRIDTGSYTIDKMCKGLLWFIAYCLFYNEFIDTGLINKKIRVEFKTKYLRYYKRKMPDRDISIETIIKNGFERIDIEKKVIPFSIGSLLYDIGKIPFVNYHDSDEPYDENMIKIHILTGYNMILKAKNFPFSVIAMTAFHHEYYGGKGSYNFTNPIISKLTKKIRTDDSAKYFITYNEQEFMKGIAYSYFPCKIIEIIDIFNALTSKKNHSAFEAIIILKKEFITQSLKIDPLLFDIFIELIYRCGLINESEHEEIDSIIY